MASPQVNGLSAHRGGLKSPPDLVSTVEGKCAGNPKLSVSILALLGLIANVGSKRRRGVLRRRTAFEWLRHARVEDPCRIDTALTRGNTLATR